MSCESFLPVLTLPLVVVFMLDAGDEATLDMGELAENDFDLSFTDLVFDCCCEHDALMEDATEAGPTLDKGLGGCA